MLPRYPHFVNDDLMNLCRGRVLSVSFLCSFDNSLRTVKQYGQIWSMGINYFGIQCYHRSLLQKLYYTIYQHKRYGPALEMFLHVPLIVSYILYT